MCFSFLWIYYTYVKSKSTKMVTYIGNPIPYDPSKTPEQIRDECKEAIEALIAKHQKKPGSICRGLYERFTKSHTSWIDFSILKDKMELLLYSSDHRYQQ